MSHCWHLWLRFPAGTKISYGKKKDLISIKIGSKNHLKTQTHRLQWDLRGDRERYWSNTERWYRFTLEGWLRGSAGKQKKKQHIRQSWVFSTNGRLTFIVLHESSMCSHPVSEKHNVLYIHETCLHRRLSTNIKSLGTVFLSLSLFGTIATILLHWATWDNWQDSRAAFVQIASKRCEYSICLLNRRML